MSAAVVLLSGGLDSTVLVGHHQAQGDTVTAISFDYGQRHRRELIAAAAVATHYGVEHTVVDLTSVGRLLTGSALTDPSIAVPQGHYTDASMKSTVVPNRNMILLSVAVGIASARGAQIVSTAVHAGDHAIYPDCRPDFVDLLSATAQAATNGFGNIAVVAPFVQWSKTDIARRGEELGAPVAQSWSCYVGGDIHCGRCGTCVERVEAFHDAGLPDPTVYASQGGAS